MQHTTYDAAHVSTHLLLYWRTDYTTPVTFDQVL